MTDKNKIKYNLRGVVTGKSSPAIKKIVDSLTPEDMDEAKKELEQEPASDDLEDAAEDYCKSTLVGSHYIKKNAFKAGAQWQKEQDQSTIELAEDHAMLAGMEKMKEQMMAKAIDGKVIANGMGNPILHLWDKGKHLIDKKVKVIIIKED